jgi:hypothetical protein
LQIIYLIRDLNPEYIKLTTTNNKKITQLNTDISPKKKYKWMINTRKAVQPLALGKCQMHQLLSSRMAIIRGRMASAAEDVEKWMVVLGATSEKSLATP